ncbi:hypothetical protein [Mycolicibacterium lacusdiani]|uniref:hypothetical protein n=1 Tax=Mycolicibacterium lacusdiani TaxID=2895283 RepID=UPI001F2A9982|nr:hypothetical protein [Mycolicibacterium lacusdiani]
MKMNLAELGKALEMVGMPPRVLALGGEAENSWCVNQASDGLWEVFWMERGNKIDLVRLATESDACFQLLGRLAYTQLAAGAIGRL